MCILLFGHSPYRKVQGSDAVATCARGESIGIGTCCRIPQIAATKTYRAVNIGADGTVNGQVQGAGTVAAILVGKHIRVNTACRVALKTGTLANALGNSRGVLRPYRKVQCADAVATITSYQSVAVRTSNSIAKVGLPEANGGINVLDDMVYSIVDRIIGV